MLKKVVSSLCSNNAMGVFSKIKGKNAEFKNPRSVGEVPVLCTCVVFCFFIFVKELYQ